MNASGGWAASPPHEPRHGLAEPKAQLVPGYADVWREYEQAGWCPVPLVSGSKRLIPKGCTGHHPMAGHGDFVQWAAKYPNANVAVRLPDWVIGIDVDAHSGKRGAETLAELEADCGPLPATYWSTSRNDGVSGIRFYRVPPGRGWISEVHAIVDGLRVKGNIEIIRFGHRYAGCWPAGVGGRTYRWQDPRGHPMGGPPPIEALPDMPASWVCRLEKSTPASRRASSPPGTTPQPAALPTAVQQSVVAGPPCSRMSQQVRSVIAGLQTGSRHEAMLGPLMSLIGLGQRRHPGLDIALREVREEFLLAVLDDRQPGEAKAEWQSLLTGGAAARGDGQPLPNHPMCSCRLGQLQASLADPDLFSRGSSGLNERKVVRYLLERADRWGSFLVQESQRQIAEAIDIHQPTVAKTLRRLVDRGWIEVESARQHGVANSYLLLEQTGTDPELSTKSQTPAKTLVDNFRSAHVHPLFGADGLGPGPAETYGLLPELIRPVRPGLWCVALRAGTIGSAVPEPHGSRRQVPGPLRQLDGVTVAEIAAARGLQVRTIRRHLARMLGYGLVVQRDGRWYRYRCNADAVVAELGIEDTSARKAVEHDRQRRGYFEDLSRPKRNRPARFEKLVADGRVSFFSVSTGEEVWSCELEHREQGTA